jgi:hypothetical protein
MALKRASGPVSEDPDTDEEFTASLRQQICAAFDVKPWQIGIAPAPWYMRPVLTYRRMQWRLRLRKDIDA